MGEIAQEYDEITETMQKVAELAMVQAMQRQITAEERKRVNGDGGRKAVAVRNNSEEASLDTDNEQLSPGDSETLGGVENSSTMVEWNNEKEIMSQKLMDALNNVLDPEECLYFQKYINIFAGHKPNCYDVVGLKLLRNTVIILLPIVFRDDVNVQVLTLCS